MADTGNDCIRFVHAADGRVETLELLGVPDARSTAGSCAGDVCNAPAFSATGTEEEKKSGE